MSRKIVVSSNCQTGGLAAAIAAMLPNDMIVPVPCMGMQASDDELRKHLCGADVWITARDQFDESDGFACAVPMVIRIPTIFFRGFHPDIIWVADAHGHWLPSPAGRMHSAIVLWGWRNGLAVEDIVARFENQVFVNLGYTSTWTMEVERVRNATESSDVDFADFFLRIRQRLPFMLTVNHPRLHVLVELARPVARQLGGLPDDVDLPWADLLRDALFESGPVWPVYPAIADALGLQGGFVWRRWNGGLLQLEEFVSESLRHLSSTDAATVRAPALDDPRFDQVLGNAVVAS